MSSMNADKIAAAIAKLQSAHWHIINRTVNEGLVDGLVRDAVSIISIATLSNHRPLPCNENAERSCRETFNWDDGVPYCDKCGLFRASHHKPTIR